MNSADRLLQLAQRMDSFAEKISWEMTFDEIEAKIHGWAVFIRAVAEGKVPKGEYPVAGYYLPSQLGD